MPLLNVIAESSLKTIKQFSPQGVANTAWAFAVLAIFNKPLHNAIAGCAVARHTEFIAQELVNLSCAFAALEYTTQALRSHISAPVRQAISDFRL